MLVTKEIEIDMGHRVPNHKSKCRNIHGHRYRIEVGADDKVVTEKGSSDEGMVIDFSDLKSLMMEHIDKVYDHSFTCWDGDEMSHLYKEMNNTWNQKINYVSFIPTAENLAKHWYEILLPHLAHRKIKIKHVRVWETPTSTATYDKD